MFRDLVRFFDEDAPSLLEEIRRAIKSGDREQIARAAHTLKGLAGNFDAQAVTIAALRMEKLSQSGEWEPNRTAKTLWDLEREISRLSDALTPYRSH